MFNMLPNSVCAHGAFTLSHVSGALEVSQFGADVYCVGAYYAPKGHFTEASVLFTRCHAINFSIYGEDHSQTVAAAKNMAHAKAAVAAAAGSGGDGGAGGAGDASDTAARFQMHSVVFLAMAVDEALDRLATNAGVWSSYLDKRNGVYSSVWGKSILRMLA
jgi:hypothetical protein